MKTNRNIFLSLCVIFLGVVQLGSHSAEAQGITKPFLWEIEGKVPSYLFGTIHLPDPSLYPLPASVSAALNRADHIYTEITLDAVTQLKATQAMFLPPDESLTKKLSPATLKKLNQYLKTLAPNFSVQMFDRLKPWAVSMQLAMLKYQIMNPQTQPLDAYIYQFAGKNNKKSHGLEKVEEQLAVFDTISEAKQIEMLELTVDVMLSNGEKLINDMMQSYKSGNMEALAKIMTDPVFVGDDKKFADEFMDKLLDKRNVKMVKEIVKALKAEPNKVHFFAVGAGHYWGEKSIQDLLKKEGFKIKSK
ncbi:MAG: TraB/GumN family protein [Pseudomonadota bacterium]